jgi:hypothetical protein
MAILELSSIRCHMTDDLLCRDGARLRVTVDGASAGEFGSPLEEGYARRLGLLFRFREGVVVELVAVGHRSRAHAADERVRVAATELMGLPAGEHRRVARFRAGGSSYRLDMVVHVGEADVDRWRAEPPGDGAPERAAPAAFA